MILIGSLHVGIANRLNKLLSVLAGNDAIINVQNPICLNDYSEPQPHIAVLHPPDDVLLLIEVTDSLMKYNRDDKLPHYAESSISEVWIVDIKKRVVEQYTHSAQGQYTQLYN